MHQRVLSVAILAGLLSLAAVACGGGDDQEAPASAAPTAAPPEETAASGRGGNPNIGGFIQEGDTVDLTVHISELVSPIGRQEGKDFEPSEMTFKVGQAVNFTPHATSRIKDDTFLHGLRTRHQQVGEIRQSHHLYLHL